LPLEELDAAILNAPVGSLVPAALGAVAKGGAVSAANSLVGSDPNDGVGSRIAPFINGNYLVQSQNWNGRRGAVTWGSGSAGVSGPVSQDNSLVGSDPNDDVGGGVGEGHHPIVGDAAAEAGWAGGAPRAR
jgi:hypothetical protein